jgi:hypothetical protein
VGQVLRCGTGAALWDRCCAVGQVLRCGTGAALRDGHLKKRAHVFML